MKTINLEELKRLQIEILDYVHAFCIKNNIKYSLCGGTLLGAIRHNGYIPWDDDIDIMLLREEYNKFIELWNQDSHPYDLFCAENGNGLGFSYAKISNPQTILYEANVSYMGINIDVFPMDYVTDDEDFICRKNKVLQLYEDIYRISGENRQNLYEIMRTQIWRLLYFYKTRDSIANKIIKIATEKTKGEYIYDLVDCRVSKTYCNKDCADTLIDVPFEGKFYKSFCGYHEYLTSTYGNYMELPPIDKRVTHHDFSAFWK